MQHRALRCNMVFWLATRCAASQHALLRSIVLLRLLQDKLSYITDVAMREQRLPRKAGSGTLWDRCGRSRRRCGAGRCADVAPAVLHGRTDGHGTVAAAGMS